MQKILLAEDDKLLADMYKNKFTRSDFDVHIAVDGEEAVSKLEQNDYDLVMLDVMMPKMNGFEVLKKIRTNSDSKKATVPVVMLTNMSQESDVDQGLGLGANDYFIKSDFTPAELVDKVKSIIIK